ncbi:MAG TPA: hypothetical protein VFB62_11295, partial [Polyangiaceae bacterium]|nr:hypothetical protein [Polyangiaceae bacterium]
ATHSDGVTWPPRWLAELERGHERLVRVVRQLASDAAPPIDLAPAASAVSDALVAIYDAIDQRVDALSSIQRAIAAVSSASEMLATHAARAGLDRVLGHLRDAEARVAAVPPAPLPVGSGILLASGDVPRLHDVARASLAPVIRVHPPATPIAEPAEPPVRDKPATFVELEQRMAELRKKAEARLGALHERMHPASPPAKDEAIEEELPDRLDERGFIRARTRELLEEILMLGLQRAPLLGDPWRSALLVEQRMLRAIDAIIAMAPRSLLELEDLSLDSPVKDGARIFGLAMTLGCLRGRDTIALVERVALDFEVVDPTAVEHFGAALKLAPHDLTPLVLRTWLSSFHPRHRAVAIDVLGYRGLATEQELLAAVVDQPPVAAAALPYLAVLRRGVADEAIERALGHDDPALRRAAWLAAALSGRSLARLESEDDLDNEAAMLIAIAGEQPESQRLVERLSGTVTPGLVNAIGWVGSLVAVSKLILLLEQDDLKEAAAWALERITGAGLWEEALMPAEDIDVAEPPEPTVPFPEPPRLVRLVSDARDAPPEPSPDAIERPSTDAARWRAWWKQHGSSLSANKRYRRGRPYSPLVSLWELDQAPCTPVERRWLGRELCIRTGTALRFDPHDFVRAQEEALKSWEQRAQRASSMPGTWNRPLPR